MTARLKYAEGQLVTATMQTSFRVSCVLVSALLSACGSSSDCAPSDWPGDDIYQPSVRISLQAVQDAHGWTLDGEDASNCDVSPNDVDETSPTFLSDYRGSRTEGCGLVIFETVGWPQQRVYDEASGELVGFRQSAEAESTFPGTTCSAASFVAGAVPVVGCPEAELRYCRALP